jgi:hypothetical protein
MKAACLVLAAVASALSAQTVGGPVTGQVFSVDYTNAGLSPSHWTLTIHPDGRGHFRSERGKLPATADELIDASDVDRDIRVSAEYAGHIFETAYRHSLFNQNCESHLKVAFQGWKNLSYTGPDGAGSCAFNYSKDKEIQELGESLVAVAGTILEGARLEVQMQHDRLGLDSETEYLVQAAQDGRVQQIITIRGILQRLAEDEEVLERVRKRAKVLLAKADG